MAADSEPQPVRFAVMLQRWCDLTFLHWRYPVESIRSHVPAPLEVESFDGSAWVGITPFVLRHLRPLSLPALPWLSDFPETNCRTYVKGPGGHSGVWFFSLDAARAAAVVGARLAYGLPYAWARMRVTRTANRMFYESTRRWPDYRARTCIVVEPGSPIRAQEFELFLTARYRLYSYIRRHLTYTNVQHPPWPLHSAQLIEVDQTLTLCAGLPPAKAMPVAHFSPGVCVRVAAPKPVP